MAAAFEACSDRRLSTVQFERPYAAIAEAMMAVIQGGSYGLSTLRIGHPFVSEDDFQRFVQALESAGWQAQ
jgi:hypothetical protein